MKNHKPNFVIISVILLISLFSINYISPSSAEQKPELSFNRPFLRSTEGDETNYTVPILNSSQAINFITIDGMITSEWGSEVYEHVYTKNGTSQNKTMEMYLRNDADNLYIGINVSSNYNLSFYNWFNLTFDTNKNKINDDNDISYNINCSYYHNVWNDQFIKINKMENGNWVECNEKNIHYAHLYKGVQSKYTPYNKTFINETHYTETNLYLSLEIVFPIDFISDNNTINFQFEYIENLSEITFVDFGGVENFTKDHYAQINTAETTIQHYYYLKKPSLSSTEESINEIKIYWENVPCATRYLLFNTTVEPDLDNFLEYFNYYNQTVNNPCYIYRNEASTKYENHTRYYFIAAFSADSGRVCSISNILEYVWKNTTTLPNPPPQPPYTEDPNENGEFELDFRDTKQTEEKNSNTEYAIRFYVGCIITGILSIAVIKKVKFNNPKQKQQTFEFKKSSSFNFKV